MTSLPKTVREQVTDLIRGDVLAGTFPSGEPLREVEIAQKFGVSRGPVRDAFLQLTQEGFLAYQANRGVTVRHPPDSSSRDLIVSLRRQIEFFVVRRGVKKLTEQQLGEIEQKLDALNLACQAEDVSQIAQCDIAFHQCILEACGGEEFLPIWKWLCSQMLLTYSILEDFSHIHQEHAAIMDALRRRSKQDCQAAIKSNIR
ncbi:MAG: GntR family transcriptional regulator [Planctomycetaceae bacterium]